MHLTIKRKCGIIKKIQKWGGRMKSNNYEVCSECGARLEEYCGKLYCKKCGKPHEKNFDINGDKTVEPLSAENNDEQAKLIEEKEKKTTRMAVIICVFVVCAIIIANLISFDGLYGNKTTKILEENNYLSTEYEVISVVENGNDAIDIKGMDIGNRIVLLRHSSAEQTEYIISEVCIEDRQVKEITFTGYKPLEIILFDVMNMNGEEQENIDNYSEIYERIKIY